MSSWHATTQWFRKDSDDFINQSIKLKIIQIVSKREANAVKDVLASIRIFKSFGKLNLHSMTNIAASTNSLDVVIIRAIRYFREIREEDEAKNGNR